MFGVEIQAQPEYHRELQEPEKKAWRRMWQALPFICHFPYIHFDSPPFQLHTCKSIFTTFLNSIFCVLSQEKLRIIVKSVFWNNFKMFSGDWHSWAKYNRLEIFLRLRNSQSCSFKGSNILDLQLLSLSWFLWQRMLHWFKIISLSLHLHPPKVRQEYSMGINSLHGKKKM